MLCRFGLDFSTINRSWLAPSVTNGGKPCIYELTDYFPLKLSDCREDMNSKFPLRGNGINVVMEGKQTYTISLNVIHKMNKVSK